MWQSEGDVRGWLKWFGAVLVVVHLMDRHAAAEIIISEIMYNPGGVDVDPNANPPFNREWIELYNTGTAAVNLAGWQIGDSQDDVWASPFPQRTVLNPGQALVVTGDAASFDSMWGTGINRIEVTNFPALANNPAPNNETVAIRNGLGIIVDEVNYDDAFGWPRADGSQGQSIFALPSGLSTTANDLGTNWKPSMFGVYGARYIGGASENHASPGFVATVPQGPFSPSADASWSMVVIPDSQNYAKSSVDRSIFTQMTQWIRDNRDLYKIQVVLHEGDIVNNNNTNNPSSGDQNSTQQWQNAQTSMFVLNGHVPYILAAGNHDYGTTDAQDRTTNINNYFRATDNPLVDPAQGGIMKGVMTPGEIQNAYYAFTTPDGRKMLVIALEWEPRPATVAWANQVAALPEYADHTAILLTHGYLNGNNSRYSSSRVPEDYSGQELWLGLVRQHSNFEMVFNGHFGGDGAGYLASTGLQGNVVHQMFFNTQFETFGGGGWMRIVEFLNDGKTVRVRTYSPFYDMTRPHPEFEFEFQISPLPTLPPLAGDYNGDGFVDAADFLLWRGTLGSTQLLAADGNGNGVIDEGDYDVWRNNFGAVRAGMAQAVAAVPEPMPLLPALVALLVSLARRGHRVA